MFRHSLKLLSVSWRLLWIAWSIVITTTLVVALAAFFIWEWRSQRALDPDQITLMQAPVAVSEGLVDPFRDARPIAGNVGFDVFYATEREPAEPGDEERFYRNGRGDGLRLGMGDITLGDGTLGWEEVKQVSVSAERDRSYSLRVANVEDFGVLQSTRMLRGEAPPGDGGAGPAARAFAERINAKLERSSRKDVYVYVHGYKVGFENPLLVATSLWHYLGYDGAMVAYAWPATPNVLAYVSDLETTRWSARHLRLLLEFLAAETDAERIHILGYSAGTGLVLSALEEMALVHSEDSKEDAQRHYRIEQVVLVCSDVDRGIFTNQLANGIWKIPKRLIINASRVDSTLGMSRALFQRRRLGELLMDDQVSEQVAELLRKQEHVTFIDVSGAENVEANNGHAYFHKSPWVSSDLLLTFATDWPPAERGLQRSEDGVLWRFPSDYVERLRAIDQKPSERR